MNVITMFDDIQRHDVGCMCGDCEMTTGRSFGVSIRECREYGATPIFNDSVIERIYAYSPTLARDKARQRAEVLGYKFLADI